MVSLYPLCAQGAYAGVGKVSVVICSISVSSPVSGMGFRDQLAYFLARPPLGPHSREVKVAQLCPALCDPMDYTVHEIL